MPYVYMIFWISLFLIIFKLFLKKIKNRNNSQIMNLDKSIYYRDIPCFESIELAYWLLYNFSDIKKNDLINGLFGAYLLNWCKKGYVDIKKIDNGRNSNFSIMFKEINWEKNYAESSIFDFLKKVSGNNNILEKNEIKNYCSIDGNKFELEFMIQNILKETEKRLESQQYITIIPSKDYILFKTQPQIILSNKIINEYQNLNGLKNYLLDFSNMDEKMHVEVHIWENYLIFANLLGIADKVKQQFNKIYPNYNLNDTIFGISFDDTILRTLNTVYKGVKIQFLSIAVTILICLLIFIGKGNFLKIILILSPIIAFFGMFYWTLKKYLINKKVKEMDGSTSAIITKVTAHYNTERDYETNRQVTTVDYSFTYEYSVNNISYKGYGHSNLKKREGQKIKIYYNEMTPEKSETSEKHNYYLNIFLFLIILTFIVIYFLIKIR